MNEFDNTYLDDRGLPYNKLGKDNPLELMIDEYRLAKQRTLEILEQNALGRVKNYDLEYLTTIHNYLFRDVYEWAGKLRTTPSAKMADKNTVSVFAQSGTFHERWRSIEAKINTFTTAKGLTLDQKVDALVDIFVEANHVHPFPDGNGRALQVFMKGLGREQGVMLDYSKTHANEWNSASTVSGIYGEPYVDENGDKRIHQRPSDRKPIKQIFANMARPERMLDRANNFVRQFFYQKTLKTQGGERFKASSEEAAKKYPELAGAVATVIAIGKQVEAHELTPQQQAIVEERVRQNVANSIERGELPEVKLKQSTPEPRREPER